MTKILFLLIFFLTNLALAVQIPWAKDSRGQAVNAQLVPKENGPFSCFECDGELILRRGQVLQAHFAHKHDGAGDCGGGPETWQHLHAKQLLIEALDKWVFKSRCRDCNVTVSKKSFSAIKGHTALPEYRFDRFVVDVMVLQNNIPLSALEVRHSHSVDEEKRSFFRNKKLPLIEVKAEQIIEAFDEHTFEALVVTSSRCKECEQKNRRPCIQCDHWYSKDILSSITPPPGHGYRAAYVCEKCQAICPECRKTSFQKQIHQEGYCSQCKPKIDQWSRDCDAALASENLNAMLPLLKNCPEDENKLEEVQVLHAAYAEISHKLKQDALEKEARERAFKEEQELIKHGQWKVNVQEAIANKNCEHLRALVGTIPSKAEVEEIEILQRHLLENEPAWQAALTEKAQAIVRSERVCLKVPPQDKEEVDRYYPEWDGEDSCTVSISHLESCAKWFVESREVIPIVATLLTESRRQHELSRKRADELEKSLPPQKRRFGNFFKKK